MILIACAGMAIRLFAADPVSETAMVWQTAPAKTRAAAPASSVASGLRFEKVSDHVYFLQPKGEGANSSAVLFSDGFLLINPPGEALLQPVLDALKKIAPRPVRWVVNTDYVQERTGGATTLVARGAAQFASKELHDLFSSVQDQGGKEAPAGSSGKTASDDSGPQLIFTRQMRLFPDNLEIRLIAVQHKARTSGDVLVFVPAEKVLVTGDLFVSGTFPQIDSEVGGGSALGWIDGLKQAIDSVPLLKSAMPPPKPDPTKPPPEEKTLEEQVTVIPGQGPKSNLQEMKDLLEAAVKVRSEAARAVNAGRGRDSVLNSPSLAPARALTNFDTFTATLFDELAAQKTK